MPIRNLNLSAIGDFFVISGPGLMSVWSRDSPTDYSFSNFIYYSTEEKTSLLAAVIKQKKLGNIIEQDITSDGRMILCLEQRSKTIKIFYQDKLVEAKKEKKKEMK